MSSSLAPLSSTESSLDNCGGDASEVVLRFFGDGSVFMTEERPPVCFGLSRGEECSFVVELEDEISESSSGPLAGGAFGGSGGA